jgi:proteasome lid subunit RPN8/RPN11
METQIKPTEIAKVVEVKKALPSLVAGIGEFNLLIPQDVQAKIDYICSKIHDVEWSGTLFYLPNGTIENGDLSIKVLDIFVQDIGTAAYTEFSTSPDMIGYVAQHLELMEDGIQFGLIHSHNNMQTFFSGTDVATLQEEGNDRNHFVSLIVNNAGKYTARVTRKIYTTRKIKNNYSYFSFNNIKIFGKGEKEETIEEIEWFNLKITSEQSSEFSEIAERLEEIKSAKEAARVLAAKSVPFTQPYAGGQYPYMGTGQPKTPVWNNRTYEPTQYTMNMDDPTDYDSYLEEVAESKVAISEHTTIEEDGFGVKGLHFNKGVVNHIVKQLLTGNVLISSSIIANYSNLWRANELYFKQRFSDMQEFKEWAETFVEVLITNASDPLIETQGMDITYSVCSNDVLNILFDLPKSPFLDEYINILDLYLL